MEDGAIPITKSVHKAARLEPIKVLFFMHFFYYNMANVFTQMLLGFFLGQADRLKADQPLSWVHSPKELTV